jgi:Golgi phosphoprotein 3 (GPP34)
VSRLADDFYLIAHHERSGRLLVAERSAGLGMAAGLLAELVLSDHLRVHEGGLFPGGAMFAPTDALLREVLALVGTPGQDRDVAGWLRFLAADAGLDVRYRLVLDKILTRVTARTVVGRRQARYLPSDPNTAAWPAIRLAKHLSGDLEMTLADLTLTGLVQVTGLLRLVLWLKPDHTPGWARADRIRAELPPDLAELVAHTEAAVGDGVLTRHG